MCQRDVVIRDFEAGDEAAFRRLNEEWIRRFFTLESRDIETLADPQRTILDAGGRIFFAIVNGQTMGCCALIRIAPEGYEIAKMAVTATSQGLGLGRRLLMHVIEIAWAIGAKRLCLLTNHALTPAIALYESVGFRRIPIDAEHNEYARADVSMELLRPS